MRVTVFSGLILVFLIGGILAAVYFWGGSERGGSYDSGFGHLLREYDRAEQNTGIGGQGLSPESLGRELDKLENKAGGAESWLSILKRRRRLARSDSRYIPAYLQSVRRARQAYPYSEPLAAVAAAALLQNTAINGKMEAELRSCLSVLSENRFDSLRLSIQVLLGDLKNPQKAAELLPQALTAAGLSSVFSASENEVITTDLALLKLLRGDSAAAEIQGILAGSSLSPDVLRFAAEYYYDFGDIRRSAELFSRLPDDSALSRQADALWLAGYIGSARTIWAILSGPIADAETYPLAARARSLYNLAFSAENTDETITLLEQLIRLPADLSRQFGLIRYSRYLDPARAVMLLEANGGKSAPAAVLLELEILKRRTEIAGTGRLTAETWLLLGRYPEEENLYRWAAWFFDSQRNYSETAILLKNAARHQFTGQWFSFHDALRLLRDGNPDAAETIFNTISINPSRGEHPFTSFRSAEVTGWAAAANLGRIFEARRDPARALEYYETAIAASPDSETASHIQFRIAQCYKTLGRIGDCRQALEYALDLNADNLNAKLELEQLTGNR